MAKNKPDQEENGGLLVSLATLVTKYWRVSVAVWLTLLLSGGILYTSVIQREGFPPISFPISFVQGVYNVDDPGRVDQEILLPITESLAGIVEVSGVTTQANANFFTVQVGFDDSVSSEEGTALVESAVGELDLPPQAQLQFQAIDPGSYLFEYDLLVQTYATNDSVTAAELDEAAQFVAAQLGDITEVERSVPLNNVTVVTDPRTGQSVPLQTNFSRIGFQDESGGLAVYNATTIGIDRSEGEGIVMLSEAVRAAIDELDLSQFDGSISVSVGADFAETINSQISLLESNMATGLLAVALVSLLLITWRASIVTALFMISVMTATIVALYVIGYSLNVITLFALILSLGLFVDDATIVVEALDVAKRDKKKSALSIVAIAIRKVGRASLAGTLTTVLVFAILTTPTGILGEFIRLIPVTVIAALILSFILSMTLIPLISRFIILRHREQSWLTRHNPVLKWEDWAGKAIERTVLSVRTAKGKFIGASMVLLSVLMVFVGMYIFGFKVDNNTFPPSKDTNQISVQIIYSPNTGIEEAQAIADDVDEIVAETIGVEVEQLMYGANQRADARQATVIYNLTPFTERDIVAPELIENLETAFVAEADNIPAQILVGSLDSGPPSSQFPFGVRVISEDEAVLSRVTADFAERLVGEVVESFNGQQITIVDSQIDYVNGVIQRDEGERYAITRFAYDSDNATLVTTLSEERFDEIYTDEVITELGISRDQIAFDAGEEGDFQDSFNTLLLAIPISLLLMYVLLAIQFRSLIQPWLILLAIPFTLFGVAAGLWWTDNAASFFALTGFIGLIGIAVNNTIMLTDYANQERREGAGPIEAIAAASRKRFRPLLATSITTVVAILPLALSDPFWEGLAYTVIFGLLSSTLLVVVSFPYYYLLLEWLRIKTRKLLGRS